MCRTEVMTTVVIGYRGEYIKEIKSWKWEPWPYSPRDSGNWIYWWSWPCPCDFFSLRTPKYGTYVYHVNRLLKPDGSQGRERAPVSKLSPSMVSSGTLKRRDELQLRFTSPSLLTTQAPFFATWPIILLSHWFTMKRSDAQSSLLVLGKANFVSSEDGAVS